MQIDRGNFAANSWTSSATGTAVRAIVSQQQPAYLAKVLGLSTVNIPAQAIARVDNPERAMYFGTWNLTLVTECTYNQWQWQHKRKWLRADVE